MPSGNAMSLQDRLNGEKSISVLAISLASQLSVVANWADEIQNPFPISPTAN